MNRSGKQKVLFYWLVISSLILATVSTGYAAATVTFTGSGSNVVAGYWNIGMTGGTVSVSGATADETIYLKIRFNGDEDAQLWSQADAGSDGAENILVTAAEIEAMGNFAHGKVITFRAYTGVPADEGFSAGITVDQSQPWVTNVTSSTSDATGKKIGDVIDVDITFSSTVTVTLGTPQIELETGTSDAQVNYTSGSGSNTLTFQYTVTSGHTSGDLDYTSNSALSLNGAAIKDAAGNSATLTLPAPGTSNSLGANKNFVVDGIRPYVSNVTSATSDGAYKVDDVIFVIVNFTEAVTVIGTPQIYLETGASDVYVNYSSGSGTSSLTFNYTVLAGHTTNDLDYMNTSALSAGTSIKDAAGNTAVLTLDAPGQAGSLGANKNIVIDTNDPTVLSVTSTQLDGYFKEGDVIPVTVTFSEAVDVTGTPTLSLNSGGVASYTSGSGTTVLTFNYSVGAGENNSDLDYVNTASLSLNGGTIQDAAANAAVLTLPVVGSANSLGGSKNLVIDTDPPAVSGVSSATANGTKKIGDPIAITITFDEAVTVTGTPQLTLETGTIDEVVDYSSGSGTTVLTFNYTVAEGNTSNDLDYAATSSLAGTIKDAAGNNAVLTLPPPGGGGSLGANKDFIIDGVRPTVSAVTSGTANGSYKADDVIPVTVTFSEDVTVSGVPQITLAVPGGYAVDYSSGSGSDVLTFNYTVQAGHTTSDLEYASTSSLSAGTSIQDAAGNDATLTLPGLGSAGSLAGSKDLIIDTTPPTVTNITSTTANGAYKATETVTITVTFTEAVTVSGTPTLKLETGTTDQNATYTSGTGTTVLSLEYTVQAGNESADLDYWDTNALTAGTSIQDAAGNDATLTLFTPGAAGSLGANKDIVIDTEAPTVTDVTSSTANGAYKAGETISVTVTFSEAVTVSAGTPTLTLETGTTDRDATYSSGTGTTTLTFDYVVQAGDISADLDYKTTNSLALNGGTIQDAAGNNATLTLANPGDPNSLGDNKELVIDTTLPTVSSVSSSAADQYYVAGEAIAITVTFTEAVIVTGTPQLTLETGVSDAVVDFTSGSGSVVLTFNYTVASGDTSSDLDYISTGALALNLGTIQDAAGNDATLTLPSPGAAGSLGANKDIQVDAVAPAVSTVTSSASDGSYKAGDVIPVGVTFSEVVTVSGVPQITLDVDGGYDVDYSSGSGSDSLTFNYTVQSGHTSSDLEYVGTSALSAGTYIRDGAGNDATLTLPGLGLAGSLGGSKDLIIDTTPPTVTNVTSPAADDAYRATETISITVTFTEAVTVTGTPQLTLETGASDAVVDYTSGSGTTVLTFDYTVALGDTSSDLDYVGTGALAPNLGTIRDAADNDATLTLPSPGAAGSLGANKAIIIDTKAPTVLNVTSSKTDGYYKAGEIIPITVTFSEMVTVSGTPTLTLETGTTDRDAIYSSGSGSDTLIFSYTVQSGDGSSDLDYVDASALSAGTSIQDAAGNDATLTLAAPGNPNSLGDNKALIIDTTPPTVSSVSSAATDGYYVTGDTISITVTLSETVLVTGTPTLTMETGSLDAVVNYTGGTGSAVLTFDYVVQATHFSSDLDYLSTTALALNGGTINDSTGNASILTLPTPGAAGSLGANKDLVVDTQAPSVTLVTSTASDTAYPAGIILSLQVVLSEAVIVTGTPTLTLDVAGGYAVDYSSGSGSDTLVFNYTVISGHNTTDLAYPTTNSLLLGGGSIADLAGNAADTTLPTPSGAGSLDGTKDLILDTIDPTVSKVLSLETDGAYKAGDTLAIEVVMSEAVLVTGGPLQLTLETGTSDAVTTLVAGTGTDTLTFQYVIQAGDSSVDLDYTGTGAISLNGGNVVDAAGNQADMTLPTPGAAGSLGDNKDIVVDTEAPTVISVTSSKSDGFYKAGVTIPVTVTFTEAVTVSGTPTLTLETGATDAVVDYAASTGTDSLTFIYTIAAGDSSTDLNYGSTTALALNGSTILDTAGNPAVLTLPALADTNSLGGGKALVVDTQPPGATLTYSDTLAAEGDTVVITATFEEVTLATPQIAFAYQATSVAATAMDTTAYSTVFTYDAIIPSVNNNDGVVTITITASDLAGNALTADSTANDTSLTIDDTPPGYVLAYSDSLVKQGDPLEITATFTESAKPTPLISLDYTDTSADIDSVVMTMGVADTIWTYTTTAPDSNDGFVTVAIVGTDWADNVMVPVSGSTNTLKVDNTPPTITPSSPVDSGFVRTTAVTYAMGETVASGQVFWTWEENPGVSDPGSPHAQALAGTELNAGDYSGILTNAPTLVQAAEYTIQFIAIDYAGNADTATISTVTYDTLAPVVITGSTYVHDGPTTDIDSTQSTDSLTAHWGDFSEPTSGITLYEYAIGTTRGDTDVVSWTGIDADTLVTAKGLRLTYKRRYYFSVRATDGAGNVSDSVSSDGVKIVDKPRLTVSVVQNSVISEYVQIFVIDTLAMADSISIDMDSLPVSVTEIDTFAYAGTHKLVGTGPHGLEVIGFSGWENDTSTSSLAMALARQGQPWVAASVDQLFKTAGSPGSVTGDRYLLVVDSTLMGLPAVRGGAYRLGDGQLTFDQPVRVSMHRGLSEAGQEEAQAIYVLRSNGRWEELPSDDEGELVTTWADRAGTFRLGRRTIIIPQITSLHQNYPNPFNPTTRIVFDLGFQDGPRQHARVVIYNLLGREVLILYNGEASTGRYELTWQGVDARGLAVASGVYFVRLSTNTGHQMTRKMLLVR